MIHPLVYITGAAIVGILHMSAPDHWLTLCIIARNKQWTSKKLFSTSFMTAIGHVALSIVMGLAVVFVGRLFFHLVSYYLDTGIGIIMVVAGLVIGIIPLLKDRRHRHQHEHGIEHDHESTEKSRTVPNKLGYFAVMGAALSPDPSIIPIYLSAISSGFYFAILLSVVFAIASIGTLLLFVQIGRLGLGKTLARIPEKYNDSLVGFVIAGIGVFVLVSAYVG